MPHFSLDCYRYFRITFPVTSAGGGQKRKHKDEEEDKADDTKPELIVQPHVIPNRGPYPYNQPKKNSIHFTPTQIEAIKSGMQPGLTMVGLRLVLRIL